MNKLIILAGVFCLLFVSCKNNNPSDNKVDFYYTGDTLYLSDQSVINSKIKLQTVELEEFSTEFNTTGVVKAIAGHIAEIAPVFDGRLNKSFVKLGQKVNAGTPIFEIHSAEFSEAVKEYFQSLQTKKAKELNLQRQKDLVKHGVGIVKELEEADADYELALKDHENAIANLKMLNINPNEISMGQPLKVVSPIAGEVVQTNMVIGQYVTSDDAPLAVVAELGKVWVVAQVKERYIGSIREDDMVEIRTDADPDQIITGYISHISELLDEETRSVQVMITCDNKDRKLRPGMFANVHFINSPKKSIVIPSTALLQNEEESYVFVQENQGSFVRRPVKAIMANQHEVLIINGLNTGDVIVAEGGIYLMGS